MSRRGAVEHTVRRLCQGHASSAGSVRLILCSKGSIVVATDGGHATLGMRDATIVDAVDAITLTPATDSEYYLVEFRPVPAGIILA